MSSDPSETLSFRCDECGKRLKAPAKFAGRKVQCPKCKAAIRAPGEKVPGGAKRSRKPKSKPPEASPELALDSPAGDLGLDHGRDDTARSDLGAESTNTNKPKTNFLEMDDPFSLASPAINDLEDRQDESNAIRAEKEAQRQQDMARRKRREEETERRRAMAAAADEQVKPIETPSSLGETSESIPFDSDDSPPLSKVEPTGAKPNPKPAASAIQTEEPAASSFDDDELQLAPLDDEPTQAKSLNPTTNSTPDPSAVHDGPVHDGLEDLDELVPGIGAGDADELTPVAEEETLEDAQYRVVCTICDTAQYVSASAAGMKIKCPDCFAEFKAPPPPKDWKPSKATKKLPIDAEIALADPLAEAVKASDEKRKLRTEALLDKARDEVDDEESESRYELEFDNNGFVQRTFGFVKDGLTMGQVVLYGIVFGLLFGFVQVGLSDTSSMFGKGMLLVTTIMLPAIGILFALPMLSGGLSLIEAVANKQHVKEIPAFNIFDNAADVIVIFVSLAAGAIPGYLIAMPFAGEEAGANFIRIAGMVITGLGLFPLFLLSMMDNGSIFAPISNAVLGTVRSAKESWASYYMKVMSATAIVLFIWLLLLNRSPILTGIAGSILPLLVFFTCQQVGVLADDIGEHLSFNFTPEDDEDDGEDDAPKDLLDEDYS
ncbi:MAG: hypothetical protein ACE361_20745 [Aureliella sp.]